MPKIIFPATLAIVLSVLSAVADDARPGPGQTTLVVDTFPLQGPTENLEPEVLDFRYQHCHTYKRIPLFVRLPALLPLLPFGLNLYI